MMSLFQSHCRPPISISTMRPPSAGTHTIRLVPPRTSTNPNSPAVGKRRTWGRVALNGSFTMDAPSNRLRTQCVQRNAARGKNTRHGLADAIVRRARTGGHAHAHRTRRRQPAFRGLFVMVLPGAAKVDLTGRRVNARRVFDVKRRHALRAQHGE